MCKKIIVSFTCAFYNFVNDFAKVLFEFVLRHEHDKNAESFHDGDFDSEVFVLVLFDEICDNVWVEIVDGVSVRSSFDQS